MNPLDVNKNEEVYYVLCDWSPFQHRQALFAAPTPKFAKKIARWWMRQHPFGSVGISRNLPKGTR